jgi:pimeloyl-ACP methyl ester carboxylesterase
MEDLPLNQIQCPTLILHGTADKNVSIADAEYAHAQIAGSEFVKLEGADHMMIITRHRELNNFTQAFLAKHASN